jgi:hypothetical protein
MIREVCSVDAGKRLVRTHPYPEESLTEFAWKRIRNI